MIQRVIGKLSFAKLPQRVVLCTDIKDIVGEGERLKIEIFYEGRL